MDRLEFWDNQHKKNDSYWLTGSTVEYILNLHRLKNVTNMKVLDLGIGLGYFTRSLYLMKNEVFACDISKDALNRVNDFAKTYLTNELKNIEPVDLAICNLVFQHCNDTEITRIINEVNLKECGIFSFQFAFIRDGEVPNAKLTGFIKEGTHYFRPLSKVIEIINNSNKKIVNISDPIHYYDTENCSWYIVEVTNK